MFVANLERSDTRSVVNCGVLKAANFITALADKGEKLDVDPDMMAGYLLVVTFGVDFAHSRAARQSANAVAAQNERHSSVGDCDAVITR